MTTLFNLASLLQKRKKRDLKDGIFLRVSKDQKLRYHARKADGAPEDLRDLLDWYLDFKDQQEQDSGPKDAA